MNTKMVGLVLLMMALVSPSLAQTTAACDGTIDVFINEHIEFEADPADESQYTYLWDEGAATQESATDDQDDFAVDAPGTVQSTDVKVTLSVTDAPTPSECAGDTCYTIDCHECCFLALDNYCTTDTPEWCWDDTCDATFTPDSSIYFKWFINTDTTAILEGDTSDPKGCYSPAFETEGTVVGTGCVANANDGYDLPTKDCPVVSNTVRLEVWQDTTGAEYPHNPVYTKLDDCTDTFDLNWDPEGNVAISTTWP